MNNFWVGACPSRLALSCGRASWRGEGTDMDLIVRNSLLNQGRVKPLSARQLRRSCTSPKQILKSFQKGPIKASGLKMSRRSDKMWRGWEQQSPPPHLPEALQFNKRAPHCNKTQRLSVCFHLQAPAPGLAAQVLLQVTLLSSSSYGTAADH